ncbi:unnamed protein product [Didymodactylos carnosus]|uniref:GEVED domain-containing protein n=1 Tax=Didymodactylos carnosus TaxID=1234261 RepID=A0A815HZA2_9BILA|nr:unnamed protein product [Didymodactylos carnosus]CAF4240423.1 unnamed protein product [Didymodactylos carnosus]
MSTTSTTASTISTSTTSTTTITDTSTTSTSTTSTTTTTETTSTMSTTSTTASTISTSTTSTTSTTTTTDTSTTSTSTTSTTTTTTPTPPIAVSSNVSFCGCSNFILSLTSISFNTTNAIYQWESSLTGQNIWYNISTPSATSSLLVASQASSTDYRCQIFVLFPSLMNLISSIVTVTNAFCAPRVVSCAAGDTVNDFVLMGEVGTLIYDLATGCAANSYDNRTNESVSLAGNMSYVALVSSLFSGDKFSVWIDFDDNCVFDSSEIVANRSLNATRDTPVIVSIPPIGLVAKTGVHRMRATLSFIYVPSPCSLNNTLGETHDYAVNILTYTRKLYHR